MPIFRRRCTPLPTAAPSRPPPAPDVTPTLEELLSPAAESTQGLALPALVDALEAKREAAGAIRARRLYLRCIMRGGTAVSIATIVIAASQDPHALFGGTYYGVMPGALPFAAAVAAAAFAGIRAYQREATALSRLDEKMKLLSREQVRELVVELARLPGDDHREALSVVMQAMNDEPAEVVPVGAPGGRLDVAAAGAPWPVAARAGCSEELG